MKNYVIDTPGFKLLLRLTSDNLKEDSISDYPEYYDLNINVECDGFSANMTLPITLSEISDFSKKLFELYSELKGTAVLKEYYCDDKWIGFSTDSMGHIFVKGNFYNFSNCHKKELYFENEFDQTYLKVFAHELYTEYVKQGNRL